MTRFVDVEARERVAAHFPRRYPNRSWVQAFLDGRIAGRTWVFGDGEAVLVEAASKLCFLAGSGEAAVLAAAADVLREREAVTLVVPTGTDLSPAAVPAGYEIGLRQQYRASGARLARELTEAGQRERVARLEAGGLALRPIVPADVTAPLMHETMLGIYGTAEHFAAHPELGFCVTDGDRIVSWFHPIVGGGVGEVGCATDPAHRRDGLTATLVYALARRLAATGHDVTASWTITSTASRRIVLHAGLRHDLDYPVLVRDAR